MINAPSSLHGTQGGETGPVDNRPNDTPAARGILATVFILLIVCSVIAAIIYTTWNPHDQGTEPVREERTTTN
ncbi:MAG: hypothetical protein QM724_12230 [Flavobacteriales bacterium]